MFESMRKRPDQPLRLRNSTCIYCFKKFDESVVATDEHVIGRRFVPKGTLNQQWNLIANACENCNGDKADLEDDMAAISLTPDHNHILDEHEIREGQRKARRSISRRTGRPVRDSQEKIDIDLSLSPGAQITFNMFAGPQFDAQRAGNLALMHIRAFFYMITFNTESKSGNWWPGRFAVVQTARRPDWGNQRFRWFMNAAIPWKCRFVIHGAGGNFKALIKRHPQELDVWAWALEWNKSVRNVGFFGLEALIEAEIANLPILTVDRLNNGNGNILAYRLEEPLPEHEDTLFRIDESVIAEFE